MPIYYVNYKKEYDGVNALIGQIHEEGVARVVATEERNFNLSKSVMMEHCFKDERKHEIKKKRKTARWLLCTFKNRNTNYMKGKIYLKEQLLKDSFEVKRYGKGLLVQIK